MTRATLSATLEAQIVSGRLAAGMKLPSERQLAERYGVSRPIVREALRSLVERDLVEARTMLECTAAELAAQRATPEDEAAIETALLGFDRAGSVIEQARYDMAFHLAIARSSRNPVIETMFGSITALTVELMLRSLRLRLKLDKFGESRL